jgi:predicted signal transduction protein with EAL and GGDEF domain
MSTRESRGEHSAAGIKARLVGAWLFVGIPLLYGIQATVRRAADLFTG